MNKFPRGNTYADVITAKIRQFRSKVDICRQTYESRTDDFGRVETNIVGANRFCRVFQTVRLEEPTGIPPR
jgi:hypothetical protein